MRNSLNYRFLFASIRIFFVIFFVLISLWQIRHWGGGGVFYASLLKAAAFAQIPMILATIAFAWRHAILVRDPPLPLGMSFRSIVLSAGLNIILPFRLSEFIKISYLRHHVDISYSSVVGAIFSEKIVDLIIIGSIGLFAVLGNILDVDIWMFVVTLFLVIAIVIALPRMSQILEPLAQRVHLYPFSFIMKVIFHVATNVQGRVFALTLPLGVLSWVFNFTSVYIFMEFQNYGELNFFQVITLFVIVTFAGAIPGLPGGIGAYEGAAVLVLTQYDFSAANALSIAVALHMSQLAFSGIIAAGILMRERTGISTVVDDAYRLWEERKEYR